MADDEDQQYSLSSTFPNPPTFWKDFTPERIARMEDLTSRYVDANGGHQTKSRSDGKVVIVPNVPEDLTNLQPPPEPADETWRAFGETFTLEIKLPEPLEQGFTYLPGSLPTPNDTSQSAATSTNTTTSPRPFDRAFELKRLAKSLLLNFLELTGILANAPVSADAKIQDINTIFKNMHQVINEYRPHQARESVIELMGEHLDRTRRETRSLREVADKAARVLEGLGSLGIAEADGREQSAVQHEKEENGRQELEGEKLTIRNRSEGWDDADAVLG